MRWLGLYEWINIQKVRISKVQIIILDILWVYCSVLKYSNYIHHFCATNANFNLLKYVILAASQDIYKQQLYLEPSWDDNSILGHIVHSALSRMAWYHHRYRGQQLCKNSARTVVSHEVASSVEETHTNTDLRCFSTSASSPWKPALTVLLYTRQNSSPVTGLHTGCVTKLLKPLHQEVCYTYFHPKVSCQSPWCNWMIYMCTHTTMDWWLSMVCWDFLSTWRINHCELVTLPRLKTDLLINLLWTGRELACKLAIRSFTIGRTVVVHPLLTSSEWCWSMHDHQRCRLVLSSMCFNPEFLRLLTVGDFIKPHKSNLFL